MTTKEKIENEVWETIVSELIRMEEIPASFAERKDEFLEKARSTLRSVGVPSTLVGNHDAGWCAWAKKKELEGTPLPEAFPDWEQYCRTGHWAVILHRVAILSERPTFIQLDEDNELHCEQGPALEYRDDFKIYAVHGHTVPGWVIDEPEKITVEAIQGEQNAETQRIMRERFGEGRYLMEIGAHVVDQDLVPIHAGEPDAGYIMRALMEDDQKTRYLVANDGSTHRVYYMQVPPEVKTCKEAYEKLTNLKEDRCLAQS